MTTRTLWNWERRPGGSERPPGRPGHGAQARRAALWAVAREYRRQGRGRVGWRGIAAALGSGVPVRLVQESLRAIKARARRRARERAQRARGHVEVHGREVLWSLDATHLGRDGEGKAIKAEVVKDVGTTAIPSASVGAPAGAAEVAALLERTAGCRGGWPLVLATDNGPENVGVEVCEVLERNRVVHLRSLPRTPQHNAWIEQAIGELKDACAHDDLPDDDDDAHAGATVPLGEEGRGGMSLAPGGGVQREKRALRGGVFGGSDVRDEVPERLLSLPAVLAAAASSSPFEEHGETRASRGRLLLAWQARLERGRRRIVEHRRRATRGYRTAEALDAIGPRGDDLVDRARFYEAACSARASAVAGLEGARDRRRAEREAILKTMECFRLITRTRGGVPIPAPKPESVS